MTDHELLAMRFEEHRIHLRDVAYRMLGSPTEADDAVQEAWLRLSRSDTTGIESLGGWLTTVVARVCLGMLRARRSRREEPFDPVTAEPGTTLPTITDPDEEALLADSIGMALLVVLDTLTPVERTAFVLHDMFAVPFDEIAPIVGRSPDAARQLASRARRRVQGTPAAPDADIARQRHVVSAFLTAARRGDFDALLALLDPQVILRADAAAAPTGTAREVHGATAVAKGALAFSRLATSAQTALVNGAVGVIARRGDLLTVVAMRVAQAKITEIEVIADPANVRGITLAVLDV